MTDFRFSGGRKTNGPLIHALMTQMKRDPVNRKIMKTKDAFVDEDDVDPDEALIAVIKKRKFLLERLLEDRQYFPFRVTTYIAKTKVMWGMTVHNV